MRRGLLLGALSGCRAVLGIHDVGEIPDDASLQDAGSPDAAADGRSGGEGGDAANDAAADGATCTGDLKTDRNNCGRCAHDCLGGDCLDGICQPVTLVPNDGAAGPITVDATSVYWLTASDVHKCATTGCGGVPTSVATTTESAGRTIAVRGATVVWESSVILQRGDVFACPTAGCGGTPTKLGSGTGNSDPTSMAADATNVYWSNNGTTTGTIVMCAIGGCGGAPANFATGRAYPANLATDDATVYWTEGGNANIVACSAGTCAGGPKTLVAQAGIVSIASNGKSLVFGSNNGITVCALPACASPTLLVSSPAPRIVAIDGGFAYWANSTGIVMSCALSGCGGNATSLAAGQQGVNGITTDANAIYWTASAPVRVMKLAKP